MKILRFFLFGIIVSIMSYCSAPAPSDPPVSVRIGKEEASRQAKEIKENSNLLIAEGLTMEIWATDSLAPDPIAMSIDDEGRIYLTRTNRQKNSEFDIRGHRDWMTPSIALQSVEDRRAFLKEIFATENSSKNEWLADLNKDGSHDWKDLAVEQDEVWRLSDEDGDGLADVSSRILSDFNQEITDVAGALLVRENDMFVGIGPDMWRLIDTNNDGLPDEKKSISHGYAVHIGFSGHGMSGVVEGPDGKIYWGIGDIGANITTNDGVVHKYPNQGVIVRSNPDGSDFEVFAAGVRNTHEFVFDEYGNMISSDNDGDHRGESERLVHIVEGSDAGWRANWQYGKYTDPINNGYNVWMDEKLYVPRWEGQAAYIIPPIRNYHNGPTGMVYNPGTALGSEWKNKFFLVEFVGNPARSHIWSFGLKPKGASFEFEDEIDVASGFLPTGIRFGPDGALYAADWVNGWDTKNYGRVWKIDVADNKNDFREIREETKRLIGMDYSEQTDEQLLDLLYNQDMRVRLKAQFELARRGDASLDIFSQAINQKENQLARIHGIWGTGQLAALNDVHAEDLLALMDDPDPEIIAQSAKALGDIKFVKAGEKIVSLLTHDYPRVKFFAAQALGRIRFEGAVQPLIQMIDDNNDEDLYLRHVGVLALSRIGKAQPIAELAESQERDLRIAAVLVLRRLQHQDLALFLKDEDEYIVTEAARAINDDWSVEGALPALAAVLEENRFTSEPLLRRAINASLRVGGEKELDLLLDFVQRPGVDPVLRAEALATLGTWSNPSVLDRVDGRYRGEIKRDKDQIIAKVSKHVSRFLNSSEPEVVIATAKMVQNLGIKGHEKTLAGKQLSASQPEVRSTMISVLHHLGYSGMTKVIEVGMKDKEESVRATALGLIGDLNISAEDLPGIVGPVFEKGSLREQQELVRVLGKMPLEKSQQVLHDLVEKAIAGTLQQGILLDLNEAVAASNSAPLLEMTQQMPKTEGALAGFEDALYGGSQWAGRRYFQRNPTGQCVRCHAIGDQGGNVGPALDNIGDVLSREEILEALVDPSARLSPGYGTTTITLKEGEKVTGILLEENEERILLRTSDAEPLEIGTSRVESRTDMPSAMPAMGTMMSKRELRDVVEFLSNQKKE